MTTATALTSAQLLNAVACLKAGDATAAGDAGGRSLPVDQQPVVTPFAPGLVVVYRVDAGSRWALVQHHHLAALNASPKGLHELGLINLGQIAEKRLQLLSQDSFKGLLLDGEHEASLMLLDDLWDGALAAHAPNGAVVALPTPDVLAFCDFASMPGQQALRTLAARTAAQARRVLTTTLYHRHGGRWLPLPEAPAPR